jgi:hypothetical protein
VTWAWGSGGPPQKVFQAAPRNPFSPSFTASLNRPRHACYRGGFAERQRLLKATLAVGTSHDRQTLVDAVNEHLTLTPPVSSSITPPSPQSNHAFGWNRPRTEAARQRRQTSLLTRWIARHQLRSDTFFEVSVPLGVGITAVVALFAIGVGMIFNFATPIVLAGGALTFGTLLLGPVLIDSRVKELPSVEFCVLSDAELDTFMASSVTRPYLRAVLASELPQILENDRARLSELCHAEQATAKRQQKEREIHEKMKQQTDRLTRWHSEN